MEAAGVSTCVCVDRTSRWGNPHDYRTLGRELAVQLYREKLERMTDFWLRLYLGKLLSVDAVMCFCAADEVCHGDVLIEMVEKVRAGER
jgi:hypothetical protein